MSEKILCQRVFAWSDLHIDHGLNLKIIQQLSNSDYQNDALLLAGDLCDGMQILSQGLSILREKFACVFYVPGNHELWLKDTPHEDSLEKFTHIIEQCQQLGIHTRPAVISNGQSEAMIVPLFSWYQQPEEGSGSLFIEKSGEDLTKQMYSDFFLTGWDSLPKNTTPAQWFCDYNTPLLPQNYPHKVISLSHFLPRVEIMFGSDEEMANIASSALNIHTHFNFSRVAGFTGIDQQLRECQASLHVYGHQHRNQSRTLDGVTYVSHCLGYPREREHYGTNPAQLQPKLIWTL